MSAHLYPPDHDAPEDDRASKAFADCIVLLSGARRYIVPPDQKWLDYYDRVLAEATDAFYETCGHFINLPMSARAWATEIMTTLAHYGLLPAIHTNESETVQDILTGIIERAMNQARFNPAPYRNEVVS